MLFRCLCAIITSSSIRRLCCLLALWQHMEPPGERSFNCMAVTHPERVTFAHIPDIRPMPSLIQIQLDSFDWFKKEGLRELFSEISPIEDFTGKNLKLEFFVPDE